MSQGRLLVDAQNFFFALSNASLTAELSHFITFSCTKKNFFKFFFVPTSFRHETEPTLLQNILSHLGTAGLQISMNKKDGITFSLSQFKQDTLIKTRLDNMISNHSYSA
jgi:hypothetical protein